MQQQLDKSLGARRRSQEHRTDPCCSPRSETVQRRKPSPNSNTESNIIPITEFCTKSSTENLGQRNHNTKLGTDTANEPSFEPKLRFTAPILQRTQLRTQAQVHCNTYTHTTPILQRTQPRTQAQVHSNTWTHRLRNEAEQTRKRSTDSPNHFRTESAQHRIQIRIQRRARHRLQFAANPTVQSTPLYLHAGVSYWKKS